MTHTIEEIERITRDFAEQRAILGDRVKTLNAEIETAKKRLLPGIRSAVEKAREKQDALRDAIESSRAQFDNPRTRIFHGIKVGIQKAKGIISWASQENVIKLIRKVFPEQAEVLIKTTEKPVRKALGNLPAADLKKIGVTVEDAGDVAVIKAMDSEVDKLVEAFLADKSEKEDIAD